MVKAPKVFKLSMKSMNKLNQPDNVLSITCLLEKHLPPTEAAGNL